MGMRKQRKRVPLTAISLVSVAVLLRFVALPEGWVTEMEIIAEQKRQEAQRSWQFQAEGGAVSIVLVGSQEVLSLQIIYEKKARPALSQEAGFIREVLKQLPSVGVDPRNIRGVQMRGFAEPDVARGIAAASLTSKEWQSVDTIPGGAGRVVKDLLNSTGAYNQLNAVFESYGYQIRVGGVENVSSARCSDLNLPGVDCSRYQNPQVPTGGNIFISLDKK